LQGDLFVQRPGYHQGEHFALASRQRFVALPQFGNVIAPQPRFAIDADSFLNCIEQILIAQRLGEKSYGAGFHRLDSHGNVTVPGHENNRQQVTGARQFTLQIQTTQARHLNIEHQACRSVGWASCQKLFGRSIENGLEADGAHQPAEKSTERLIVVDNYDDGRRFVHEPPLPQGGREIWNIAPGP
jgi:hypothetical protein